MKKVRLIVAAAQMKFRRTIDENVTWIVDAIHSAAGAGADVVLFPECAVSGYNRDFTAVCPKAIKAALETIARAARRANCNVLVGCPTFSGRRRRNSLVVIDRRGQDVFCYAKIHLTPRDAGYFVPGNKLAFFHLD